jgi:hypothetical protein
MRVKEYVCTEKIEQPTALSQRCSLLMANNLNPYVDPEEVIYDFLIRTKDDPSALNICLNGRCKIFIESLRSGSMPFMESEPVYLTKYKGHYWVDEGKHRICCAKRLKIKEVEAYVYHSDDDGYLLLDPIGVPGTFTVKSTCTINNNSWHVSGDVFFLWYCVTEGLRKFDLDFIWFDAKNDTQGIERKITHGITYSTKVVKHKGTHIETKICIEPTHPKAKIWLVKIPSIKLLKKSTSSVLDGCTHVYRHGLWRRYHLYKLEKILGGPSLTENPLEIC